MNKREYIVVEHPFGELSVLCAECAEENDYVNVIVHDGLTCDRDGGYTLEEANELADKFVKSHRSSGVTLRCEHAGLLYGLNLEYEGVIDLIFEAINRIAPIGSKSVARYATSELLRVIRHETIRAQILYDVREITGVITETELMELFLEILGVPSPSGYTSVPIKKLVSARNGWKLMRLITSPLQNAAEEIEDYVS